MSAITETAACLVRALDERDLAAVAELAPAVCHHAASEADVAAVVLAPLAPRLEELLGDLASSTDAVRLATLDVRNAIEMLGGETTPDGDRVVRGWLHALSRASLTTSQRVELGLAALAFGEWWLAAEVARTLPADTDQAQRQVDSLRALIGVLTGPRHPILFGAGVTARPAVRMLRPTTGIDRATLLWIGRIVHVDVLQLPVESSARAARWEIDTDDDVTDTSAAEAEMTAFPWRERVGGYTLALRLLGRGRQQLWLATNELGAHALVSVDGKMARQTLEELRSELRYPMPGGLDIVSAGFVERPPQRADGETFVESTWLVAEACPPGTWLPHIVPRLRTPTAAVTMAVELGLSAARIAARIAAAGTLVVRARPEYMWGTHDGRWEVTGITDRADHLFALRRYTATSRPLFDRFYYAPESKMAPTDRSVVFTLAVMIAEWATGRYPFPSLWPGRGLEQAAHLPIEAPDALRELLERSLRREPHDRPTLHELVTALEQLA